MNIFNETNELAEKISNLLNKEGIEEELGTALLLILEDADSHLMRYLEHEAERRILPAHAHAWPSAALPWDSCPNSPHARARVRGGK